MDRHGGGRRGHPTSAPHHGQGVELGQDHHHHPHLCPHLDSFKNWRGWPNPAAGASSAVSTSIDQRALPRTEEQLRLKQARLLAPIPQPQGSRNSAATTNSSADAISCPISVAISPTWDPAGLPRYHPARPLRHSPGHDPDGAPAGADPGQPAARIYCFTATTACRGVRGNTG